MLSKSLRLKASLLALSIVFQCIAAGNGYAQEAQPEMPGGAPKEARRITQFVQFYIVNDENLQHPEALKRYFEWRCREIYKDKICLLQFWKQASLVPMQGDPQDMSDEQFKARAGTYNLNLNTGKNTLQLERDGEVAAQY